MCDVTDINALGFLDEFANAFYDENYKKMSKMLGKKITNLEQAEKELERLKKRGE